MIFKVFTDKLLFSEWLLAINIAIGKKITKYIARIEIDRLIENDSNVDMRSLPVRVKKHIIYDQDILKHRWDLCKGCEFLTESNRCTKCGCFMNVKHKITMARCPIGKWDKHTEVSLGTY